jgi:hypothetical protein
MAATTTGGPASTRSADRYESDTGGGYGWVVFAGSMLALVGTLNFIYGIAAVSNSKFYVRDVSYVISDLNTWGWFLLIIGAIQFLAAFGIWTGSELAKWIGILSAGANAIVQMLALPGYPFLSLALFTIDILVIYGLVAHGGRKARID